MPQNKIENISYKFTKEDIAERPAMIESGETSELKKQGELVSVDADRN